MKKSITYLFFTILPLISIIAQPDLSGTVSYPDSTGIDLIRVEVWQNNQQLASTVTDSIGYFEIDSIITTVNETNLLPLSFKLYPNYPSPFDKTTNIIYEVDKAEAISITIYNSIGQQVTTLESSYRQKGIYIVQWDGKNSYGTEAAQGIYFARLDNGTEARFMKLLKMNGALNANGTTIPGNFYRTYKGSSINQDYRVKFIDTQLNKRVDEAEITIPLPAQIHQMLTERFIVNQYLFYIDEGDTLTVLKDNWSYGTGPVQNFKNLSVDWLMWEDSSQLYFTTVDPNVNGWEEISLKTTAIHSTTDTSNLVVNISEITTWSGQFVDDMKYKKLLGIIEPGAGIPAEIYVELSRKAAEYPNL